MRTFESCCLRHEQFLRSIPSSCSQPAGHQKAGGQERRTHRRSEHLPGRQRVLLQRSPASGREDCGRIHCANRYELAKIEQNAGDGVQKDIEVDGTLRDEISTGSNQLRAGQELVRQLYDDSSQGSENQMTSKQCQLLRDQLSGQPGELEQWPADRLIAVRHRFHYAEAFRTKGVWAERPTAKRRASSADLRINFEHLHGRSSAGSRRIARDTFEVGIPRVFDQPEHRFITKSFSIVLFYFV